MKTTERINRKTGWADPGRLKRHEARWALEEAREELERPVISGFDCDAIARAFAQPPGRNPAEKRPRQGLRHGHTFDLTVPAGPDDWRAIINLMNWAITTGDVGVWPVNYQLTKAAQWSRKQAHLQQSLLKPAVTYKPKKVHPNVLAQQIANLDEDRIN